MYFILVDSGRTDVLASDVKEALRCIRCGACMNHCPVYQNIGGHSYGWVYPGPIGSILTPDVRRPRERARPAARVDVLQPVRRRVPGQDSAARPAAQAARAVRSSDDLRPWRERAGLQPVGMVRAAARGSTAAASQASACACCASVAGAHGMIHKLPLGAGWTRGARHARAGRAHLSRALRRAREARRSHRMNATA